MKNIIFIVIILFFVSCKEDIAKKPDQLIEKEVMVNVMYDLSIFNAIKYQKPTSLDGYNTNELEYIYKKYKIDSTQFVQSNTYYTSNYKEYKDLFDQVTERINSNKTKIDTIVSREEKKKDLLKKAKETSLDTLVKKKSLNERLKEGAKANKKEQGILDLK